MANPSVLEGTPRKTLRAPGKRMRNVRGRSAGAVIPALGSGRYSPGPHIVWPSWLQGSDPPCTLNVFWGQPGALATVSCFMQTPTPVDCDASAGHLRYIGEDNIIYTVLLFFNDKYFTS